ncbi:MAG: heme exporter protein CcmB [bacterium]
MTKFAALLQSELTLWWRGAAAPAAIGFYILAAGASPLVIGRDVIGDPAIAAGLLWFLSALTVLSALEALFGDDVAEGRLEILWLSGISPWQIALIKILAFWMGVCLPAIVAVIPLSILLGLTMNQMGYLAGSLLLGTPALALLGGALAAICAGIRRGAALVIILALPLFIPILIFGSHAATNSENAVAAYLYLAALSLLCLALCPVIAAQALRQQLG